jgi:heavy metal sensor kinase
VRLTLWHVAALATVLVVYAGGVFVLVGHGLREDLDRQLREDFDRAEQAFRPNPDGSLTWLAEDRDRIEDLGEATDAGERDTETGRIPMACAWALNGRPLYRDPLAPWPVLAAVPDLSRLPVVESVRTPGGAWIRQLTGEQELAGSPALLRVARSEEPVRRELRELLLVLALGLPLACLAAGVGGYLVARRALAPVDRMATAAQRITAARLGDRLPVENPHDELGHLATVFNQTFGRLEASFEQLRRFTADASHEMRTPLTAIRTVGEVGLRGPRSDRTYRDVIGSMLEEADRLNGLVESLLTLARADGPQFTLRRDRIDLAALAAEVVEYLSVLAEDKHQVMAVDAPAPVFVLADRVLLRQAIINLVDNAIKYSPDGGAIHVTAAAAAPDAVLAVRDSGPGIPPEHVEKVFDRFYRIDRSRSREVGGTGLGLSIAKWAVEVHGGRIGVAPADTAGSVFRITLPLA